MMPRDGLLLVGWTGFTASSVRSNCSSPRFTVNVTGWTGLLLQESSSGITAHGL